MRLKLTSLWSSICIWILCQRLLTDGQEVMQHILTTCFIAIFAKNRAATMWVACGCGVFVALPHFFECVAFDELAACSLLHVGWTLSGAWSEACKHPHLLPIAVWGRVVSRRQKTTHYTLHTTLAQLHIFATPKPQIYKKYLVVLF